MLCLIQQRCIVLERNKIMGGIIAGENFLPKYYKETNYKIMELVFRKASRNFF